MGLDDSELDRLLAGRVPADDPASAKVSAFLGDLDASYPPPDVSGLEERHLALVARELRAVSATRAGLRPASAARIRVRRALAAGGTALVVALTAGVGAAAAMGVNPLQFVPDLLSRPLASPDLPSGSPVPTSAPTDDQSGLPTTQPPSVDPSVPPATTAQPNVSPTHGATGNCGNGRGEGNATCTNGNSGKENPGKPTAKPSTPNHGNSGKEGRGRPTAKPTPPHGKATPGDVPGSSATP